MGGADRTEEAAGGGGRRGGGGWGGGGEGERGGGGGGGEGGGGGGGEGGGEGGGRGGGGGGRVLEGGEGGGEVAGGVLAVRGLGPVGQGRGIASAQRLGVRSIDLDEVHQRNPRVKDATAMRGMRALHDVGLVDEVGVSNYPLDRGERPVLKAGAQLPHGCAWAPDAGVRPVDVRVNGGVYNLTDRKYLDYLSSRDLTGDTARDQADRALAVQPGRSVQLGVNVDF